MNQVTSYKGRAIDPLQHVKVYRNLHRGGYSVQQRGLVVAHADAIQLYQVTFQVSEAGRQRVIAAKKKAVHAYVVGSVIPDQSQPTGVVVSYNPYKFGSFYTVADGVAVATAGTCQLDGNGCTI